MDGDKIPPVNFTESESNALITAEESLFYAQFEKSTLHFLCQKNMPCSEVKSIMWKLLPR